MGLKSSKQIPADQAVRGDVVGKHIIITGGTNGIGKEAARVLFRHGANVILAARDLNKCSQVVEEITTANNNSKNNTQNNNNRNNNNNNSNNNNKQPGSIKCMQCDLESFDSMTKFVKNIVQNEPKIDTLINGAGLFKAVKEYTGDSLERMMQVNYMAPFYLSVALLGHMNTDGRILNVAGGSYKYGYPNPFVHMSPDVKAMPFFEQYASSKLALMCLTHYLNLTTQPRGVTVNAINPGLVDNAFHSEYIPAQVVKRVAKWFGRLLTVEKAASAVVWAASSPSTIINGGKIVHGRNIENMPEQAKQTERLANVWKYSEDTTEIRGLYKKLYPEAEKLDLLPRERSINSEEEDDARKRAPPVTDIADTLQPPQYAIDKKYYDPLKPDLLEIYLGRPIVNNDNQLPGGRLPSPTQFVAVWDPKTIYIWTEPDDYKYEISSEKKKTWFWGYRYPKNFQAVIPDLFGSVRNGGDDARNNTVASMMNTVKK